MSAGEELEMPQSHVDLTRGQSRRYPTEETPMLPTGAAPLAYKGLDTMPTWFVITVVVLALIGIGLAVSRGRR